MGLKAAPGGSLHSYSHSSMPGGLGSVVSECCWSFSNIEVHKTLSSVNESLKGAGKAWVLCGFRVAAVVKGG